MERKLITRGSLGCYSELIAAAAFCAEGWEVALPMSRTQKGWDLVVRRAGSSWVTVQVKTVGTAVSARVNMTKNEYAEGSFDLLVAIHPETGTLWRENAVDVIGKENFELNEDNLWRGVIQCSQLPATEVIKPYSTVRREKLSNQRIQVREKLPRERPEWMKEKTWDSVVMWCNGATYKEISESIGASGPGAWERTRRALYRLGLVGIPSGMLDRPNPKAG